MNFRLQTILPLVGFLTLSISVLAQRGPGGVSHDTPAQSDNRLWLKAGSLTNLADGANVYLWNDISPSAINDAATNDSNDDFLPPFFRDDPSASINGHPVITFEEGRLLKINSSTDLNTDAITTYEQTIVAAFRTSEDVTSRQVIWEEGGGWRGMNIYIFNGELYLGAYDRAGNDPDDGGTSVPQFGFSYVKTPVQPNTTYILSHLFYAPTDNSLNGYVKGYRNGSYFGTLQTNGDFASGVGGVYRHPNPIGVGGVNSGAYMETGNTGDGTGHVTGTGNFPFKGRLAEICYYNRLLNDAERIIIENYLGAKYYASSIANDKYDYQGNYSHDVIGIGQTMNSATQRHKISQGTNPFEIRASNESGFFNTPNKFLLVGHNGASMNLTTDNTPNDSGSTKRTFRIWRFDKNGTGDGNIKFRFTAAELPPLPAGFTKYVAIFDRTSVNFPNFSTSNAVVNELKDVGGGIYEMTQDIVDGAFMTIGVLKPQVSFRDAESFVVEGDPPPDSTLYNNLIYVQLNYIPQNPVTVDLSISDGTAIRGVHYGYMNSDFANGITFPPTVREIPLRIWVVNDEVHDANETIKYATLNLEIGSNTTGGLGLGNRNQNTFSIYDDDPPPVASFTSATSNIIESGGTHNVEVLRAGSTVGSDWVSVKVISSTATSGVDFQEFLPTTVVFDDGESSKTISLNIIDDNIDEYDETIVLQLVGPSSLGPGAHITHTVTIVDDDLPPVAGFASAESQNYETFGNPSILIQLDRPSAKDVTVSYTTTENLSTAATYEVDYTLESPGAVNIPPGDTLANPLTFIVSQDGLEEDDETVEFLLTGAINATLGDDDVHVYTIKDYSTFEWRGAGGIGKDSDDIIWMDADRQSGTDGISFSSLTNFSPHNIELNAQSSAKEAKLRTNQSFLNNRKSFEFDRNNDVYKIDNSGLVNRANFNSKAMFFAIHTGGNVNQRQVLYKQGFDYRGLVVYIQSNTMYVHIVNHYGDPNLKWGYDGSVGSARFASFSGILPNTDYVVSCMFDKDNPKRIRIYINGQEGASETGDCGTFIIHGEASLGGVEGSVRFHDGTTGAYKSFGGNIAEFIYFSDAPVNESRRIILENYLAMKYDIALNDNAVGSIGTEFDNEPAGIGAVSASADDLHIDSQGQSILRIKTPGTVNDNSFLMWAHNNRPLTESWPWSNGYLPTGIIERSGMVWRASKTGTIDDVQVRLEYSALEFAADFNTDELKLLVHNNSESQDFSNATVYDANAFHSGYVVEFLDVQLGDGDYFALASGSSVTPLPIELLGFDAKIQNGVVDILWRTASEKNSDFFSVQRSKNLNEWEEVVRTPGAGDSNSLISYREKDRTPLPGLSYYRLKQVDFDGSFTYSPIAAVLNLEDGGGDDVYIYPNPVRGPSFFILLPHHLTEEATTIRVFDLLGRPVWEGFYDDFTHMREIPVTSLPPGTYIVHVYSTIINESKKIIVE